MAHPGAYLLKLREAIYGDGALKEEPKPENIIDIDVTTGTDDTHEGYRPRRRIGKHYITLFVLIELPQILFRLFSLEMRKHVIASVITWIGLTI